MKAKLTVNGKELEVDISDGLEIEISDKELEKLKECNVHRTGYEKVEIGDAYYHVNHIDNVVRTEINDNNSCYDYSYDTANYYSNAIIAKNNARADRLMRQLRRFAVEHRESKLDWNNTYQEKYYIYFYSHLNVNEIKVNRCCTIKEFCQIYFDSEETANLAIDTFKDELLWYFTEYQDSL